MCVLGCINIINRSGRRHARGGVDGIDRYPPTEAPSDIDYTER